MAKNAAQFITILSNSPLKLDCKHIRNKYLCLTLSDPAFGKTLRPGGGPLWPPLFFSFGATKSPKLKLNTFLALKTTWKAILNIFRSLNLVARGRQISINIIVEKFKIFKISSFKGVMHIKWKLRTCTIQIELEKVAFVSKKIKKIQNFLIFA